MLQLVAAVGFIAGTYVAHPPASCQSCGWDPSSLRVYSGHVHFTCYVQVGAELRAAQKELEAAKGVAERDQAGAVEAKAKHAEARAPTFSLGRLGQRRYSPLLTRAIHKQRTPRAESRGETCDCTLSNSSQSLHQQQ